MRMLMLLALRVPPGIWLPLAPTGSTLEARPAIWRHTDKHCQGRPAGRKARVDSRAWAYHTGNHEHRPHAHRGRAGLLRRERAAALIEAWCGNRGEWGHASSASSSTQSRDGALTGGRRTAHGWRIRADALVGEAGAFGAAWPSRIPSGRWTAQGVHAALRAAAARCRWVGSRERAVASSWRRLRAVPFLDRPRALRVRSGCWAACSPPATRLHSFSSDRGLAQRRVARHGPRTAPGDWTNAGDCGSAPVASRSLPAAGSGR